MLDLTQILLVVVISILTTLLIIVSYQVILILKEFRQTLLKTNRILDNIETVSNNVVRPITNLTHLLEGVKNGVKIAKIVSQFVGPKPQKPATDKKEA